MIVVFLKPLEAQESTLNFM